MGKKSKKNAGPPYDPKDAEYAYIVIENPWGLGMAPRECVRDSGLMNAAASTIAAWVYAALEMRAEEVFFKGGNVSSHHPRPIRIAANLCAKVQPCHCRVT
jgi:hypothetical protein